MSQALNTNSSSSAEESTNQLSLSAAAWTQVLYLLTFELPDPQQELYLQHSNDLLAFAFFPQLPLELRFQIWKYTFPAPREIYILEFPGDDLPVALFINKESRRETLRHYSVIPLPAESDGYVGKPFCLGLKIDTVVIVFTPPEEGHSFLDLLRNSWMRVLEREPLDVLLKVENVEITCFIYEKDKMKHEWRPKELLAIFPSMKLFKLVIRPFFLFDDSGSPIKFNLDKIKQQGKQWIEKGLEVGYKRSQLPKVLVTLENFPSNSGNS